MRFETQIASNYLTWRLQAAGIVQTFREDGGDILLLDLKSGHTVMIHLIEQPIALPEIKDVFARNTARGIYTLYTFWADMLLPRDGWYYETDPWMSALLQSYENRIYGYEVAGREAFFFPVLFEGTGKLRDIRFGPTVTYRTLGCRTVETPHGLWRVSGFAHYEDGDTADEPFRAPRAGLAGQYDILGIREGATIEAVKLAYRGLARRYHPDVNPSEQAVERMKSINVAYAQIVAHLTGDKD